ncbi:MAG: hypothetical protein HLUCCA08_13710 [Rhodobacteraceae bacterium HLUCCA08]|nr:MAG: hypothetical protein HLUCCA08_13710 [Rhodobacteraceae bacterium HLUCCA08]
MRVLLLLRVGLVATILSTLVPDGAGAQVTAFRQAVAETAAIDEDLAAFYRGRAFEGIWTGSDAAAIARRNALLNALDAAPLHGLPAARFDPRALMADLRDARTAHEKGVMEVRLTETYLDYARAVQSGLLTPRSVVSEIRREVVYTPRADLLAGFAAADNPAAFLRGLPPSTDEYVRLMQAAARLEHQIAAGGWGAPVPAGRLEPGNEGAGVIALRDRLVAMGYLDRSVTLRYDASIEAAVRRFQQAHGLTPDGIVGEGTLDALNRSPEQRLQQVFVAMERERWFNQPRGARHIWVNLTDFHAAIVDDGAVTFTTRSVIGATNPDRQSPEFSDQMSFMVINPSWYVPRSITVNEYLPGLRNNPNAHGHLQVLNSRGQVVNRGAVNFSRYNASNFPFSMRQPPSPNNALGQVKFMFPNPYNIYLHDTPAQSLFSHEVRAYSHGCIRLDDPYDFAYALLAAQESDPVGFFQARLRSGAETRVNLEQPVPVHLVYRTAFTSLTGELNFRRDIYGRDARIWAALEREGVVIPGGAS